MLLYVYYFFFFFKQKTAYEMRISDWSSDVCSSDLEVWSAIVTDPAIYPVMAPQAVVERERLPCVGRGRTDPQAAVAILGVDALAPAEPALLLGGAAGDRKSTRLNSSH